MNKFKLLKRVLRLSIFLLAALSSFLIACGGDYDSIKSTYIITFNANGGIGGPGSVEAVYGEEMPDLSLETKPTNGTCFFGGYFDAQIDGVMYYTPDLTSARTWDKNKDEVLYAHWTPAPQATIVFNSNFGNYEIRTQIAELNASISLETNTFTRTGYTFLGWSLSSIATTETYLDGANYTVTASSVTLYAIWAGDAYAVTFNANEGTGGPTTIEVTFGQPMPNLSGQTAPTREGLYFAGYFDAQIDGTMYYNASLTSVRTWYKANNAILYAQWRVEREYQIGDIGPSGGIIFYVSATGFTVTGYGTAYYLEAAPADMEITLAWALGDFANTLIGGIGTAIGSGRDNTDRILAVVPTAPAALACRNYTGGGKTDWFLPSRDELNQLCERRHVYGSFTNEWYWSSSEDNSDSTWAQSFGCDCSYSYLKYSMGMVRAIRAF